MFWVIRNQIAVLACPRTSLRCIRRELHPQESTNTKKGNGRRYEKGEAAQGTKSKTKKEFTKTERRRERPLGKCNRNKNPSYSKSIVDLKKGLDGKRDINNLHRYHKALIPWSPQQPHPSILCEEGEQELIVCPMTERKKRKCETPVAKIAFHGHSTSYDIGNEFPPMMKKLLRTWIGLNLNSSEM